MRLSLLALGAAAALAIAGAAHAQTGSVALTDLSTACGLVGSSAQVVVPPAGGTTAQGYCATVLSDRATIFIANSSAAATVSCGYNNSITVNGQGTFTLAPGWSAFWPRGTAPKVAIYCVASAGSTPTQVTLGN